MIKNLLGIKGWIFGGKFSLQRYAYTLQRITGLGIILYLLMHLYVTGFKIKGANAWKGIMETVHHPILHFFEFLLFVGVIYHALNGFRLILAEFGIGIGKPGRQVYPYTTSVDRQKGFFFFLMFLVLIIVLVGAADFYLLPK